MMWETQPGGKQALYIEKAKDTEGEEFMKQDFYKHYVISH